jgi:hypothetical protein
MSSSFDVSAVRTFLQELVLQQKFLESSAMPITGIPYLDNILDVCKPVTESSLITIA